MQNHNHAVSGGYGILSLLGIAFIVLRLCKVIDWSWVWVLVPFWGPIALVVVLFVVLLGAHLIVAWGRK